MPPRIEPATPPFAPEVENLIARTMPPGVPTITLFATLARDPRLFMRFAGRGFLGRGHLTIRQREIIIDRVTAQCGSEYEWGIHVAWLNDQAELTDDQLYSTVHGGPDDECWAEDEKLLLRLCDSLDRTCDVDDDLWAALKAQFSDEAIMEMIMVAGNYRSASFINNALRFPLEPFALRFPPRRPAGTEQPDR